MKMSRTLTPKLLSMRRLYHDLNRKCQTCLGTYHCGAEAADPHAPAGFDQHLKYEIVVVNGIKELVQLDRH